jgi:hypothetical protein
MTKVHLTDLTFDADIQLRARNIDPDTVQDYVQGYLNDAPFPPVIAFREEDGQLWLADGFHRLQACRFLGLAEIDADIRSGTRKDAMVYAAIANVANGKPMSRAEKEEAGKRLLRLTEWSDYEIARRLAISHRAVLNWRHEEPSRKIFLDKPRTVTRAGTTYTMDTAKIGKRAAPETPDDASSTQSSYEARPGSSILHRVEPRLPKPPGAEPGLVIGPHPSDGMMSVHYSSQSPEHYTPQTIIDATLACLGNIDLDPCSNSHEQPNVPALHHFTQGDDGLRREWHGRVYMNPPYGQEIDRWIEKLCAEHTAQRAVEAIALVPSRTDTQWWLRLRDFPVCFITGRLTFGGNDNPAPFPSAVFYLGENVNTFYRAFEELGDCWQRMMPGISFGE